MESNFIVLKFKRSINNSVDFCHFTQPFPHKKNFKGAPSYVEMLKGYMGKERSNPCLDQELF